MKVILDKAELSAENIKQIADLFCGNYINYHYEKLCNSKGIMNLIGSKEFNCVCIVDGNKVCGFAGYYILATNCEAFTYSLAHLLVDINYRGKGYGSFLEDLRLNVIKKKRHSNVIYASCVEIPFNSIQMKLDRGFKLSGFRYQYRPNDKQRGNSVVMVDNVNFSKKVNIEFLTASTKKLINLVAPDINCVKMKECEDGDLNACVIRNEKEIRTGREIFYVYSERQCCDFRKRISVDKMISDIVKSKMPYKGIRIDASIKGLAMIDELLIQNDFFPLAYIPHFPNGLGLIEYQYLPHGVDYIIQDDNVSEIAKDFVNCLR